MADAITFTKITSLALADAVNPCAIAVMTMVLMAVLIQHPEKRKKVLYSGLAFTASVYLGYMFYGVVIIKFFTAFAEFMRTNSLYIYDGLAILAMIIGALNIKDYFMYKPGGLATEMPIWMRPRVKKIIKDITSVWGAFVIGFLVTLFLLPCTMGPYIVASGILSQLTFMSALPWLLYYNFIFVIPMIAITIFVYVGFTTVENVSGWKERNIRRLHLIAGILMFLVGLALLLGWI